MLRLRLIKSALKSGFSKSGSARSARLVTGALLLGIALVPGTRADTIITPQLSSFSLTNTSADGSVVVAADGLSFVLTGGNDGSGLPGFTDFTAVAPVSGIVQFQWSYASLDTPGYDNAGYELDNVRTQLADTDGEAGMASFSVTAGQLYGWYGGTVDNTGEPGILTVEFSAAAPVPEPRGLMLLAVGLTAAVTIRWRLLRAR